MRKRSLKDFSNQRIERFIDKKYIQLMKKFNNESIDHPVVAGNYKRLQQ